MGMGLYRRVLRPLLFAFPPDRVHDWTQWLFRRPGWRGLDFGRPPRISLETRVGDLTVRNPIGLAAGFDKNGDITPAMAALGFGFVVVGSVRPVPHPGNPRPWFARRAEEGGLVNAMGLPSKGADHVARRLREGPHRVPALVSVAGESPAEFREVCTRLGAHAEGWEVNVSCPNTETGRAFEEDPQAFEMLLEQLPRPSPTAFVKFSPYRTEEDRERTLELAARARKRGFRGFTLCNTLPVADPRVARGRGGLSGRPLFAHVLDALGDFRDAFGDDVDLMAVGGINRGADVLRLLEAGAQAVQLLTALILEGPGAVLRVRRELARALAGMDYASLAEAVGRTPGG